MINVESTIAEGIDRHAYYDKDGKGLMSMHRKVNKKTEVLYDVWNARDNVVGIVSSAIMEKMETP